VAEFYQQLMHPVACSRVAGCLRITGVPTINGEMNTYCNQDNSEFVMAWQDEAGQVVGATVHDCKGNKDYSVYARQVRLLSSTSEFHGQRGETQVGYAQCHAEKIQAM